MAIAEKFEVLTAARGLVLCRICINGETVSSVFSMKKLLAFILLSLRAGNRLYRSVPCQTDMSRPGSLYVGLNEL